VEPVEPREPMEPVEPGGEEGVALPEHEPILLTSMVPEP